MDICAWRYGPVGQDETVRLLCTFEDVITPRVGSRANLPPKSALMQNRLTAN